MTQQSILHLVVNWEAFAINTNIIDLTLTLAPTLTLLALLILSLLTLIPTNLNRSLVFSRGIRLHAATDSQVPSGRALRPCARHHGVPLWRVGHGE